MNLPNYFLADLPPEATLSPAMITEACQTLKHNRERYLANRSTESLIKTLSRVADGWLEPDNSFRKLALELGPAQTGFSRETLARGLDNFFGQLTRENFHALLVQEFGDVKRLDALARRLPSKNKIAWRLSTRRNFRCTSRRATFQIRL